MDTDVSTETEEEIQAAAELEEIKANIFNSIDSMDELEVLRFIAKGIVELQISLSDK